MVITRFIIIWRLLCRRLSGFVIAILLSLFTSTVAHALTSDNPVTTTALKPVSAMQMQKDTLVVGSEQNYPPFATGMTDATAGGFTVDLWKAVAAEAGLSYTIRVRPFRQILQEFKEGKVDVLINLAQSEERHRFADFAVHHAIVHGAIFVRKGHLSILSEDDLAGKSIIVINADLAHDYAVTKGWEQQLVLVDNAEDGLRLLASGKYDAMLLSKLTGMQTLQALGLSNIEVLKTKVGFSQKFAFAVQEGQSELLGKINEGLALTKSNGTYNALYDQWFGIYEDKEIGPRDLLKYIIPIVLIFLGIAGYFYYRWQAERRTAQKALQESEAHLRLSQIGGGIGTWEADLVNNRQMWSENCIALLGVPAMTDPKWEDFLALVYPEDRQRVINATQSHIEHGIKYDVEYRTVSANGDLRWIRSAGQAEYNAEGKPIVMRGIAQDISERKAAEAELLIAAIAFESQEGMLVTDANNIILRVNRAFTHITGYGAEEIVGKSPHLLSSGMHDAVFYAVMWDSIKSTGAWAGEIWNRRKSGEVYPEHLTITAVKDQDGVITNYVATLTDITLRKSAAEEIQNLAFYDPLTCLPNWRLLLDRLKQALTSSTRSGRQGALLFLDLDSFKTLNDSFGHDVGDLLLQQVSERLTSCVREGDTVHAWAVTSLCCWRV